MTISGAGSAPLTQRVTMAEATDAELLPRVAAARRLSTLPEDEAAALAEAHQLVSKYTSFVVVQERAEQEKAKDLPELRKVAQMLAAGWGATALVEIMANRTMAAQPCMGPSQPSVRASRSEPNEGLPGAPDQPAYEQPAWTRSRATPRFASSIERSPAEVLAAIAARASLPKTFAELAELGVPAKLLEQLAVENADSHAHGEATLVRTLIAILARSPAGDGLAPDLRTRLSGDIPGYYLWGRVMIEPLLAYVSKTAWSALSQRPDTELTDID